MFGTICTEGPDLCSVDLLHVFINVNLSVIREKDHLCVISASVLLCIWCSYYGIISSTGDVGSGQKDKHGSADDTSLSDSSGSVPKMRLNR